MWDRPNGMDYSEYITEGGHRLRDCVSAGQRHGNTRPERVARSLHNLLARKDTKGGRTAKADPHKNTHETVTKQRKMPADTRGQKQQGKGGQGSSLCGLSYPWPDTYVPTRWQGDKPWPSPPPTRAAACPHDMTVRRVDDNLHANAVHSGKSKAQIKIRTKQRRSETARRCK